jgi:drug/metabolite transporter (DMT)-like permease
MKGERIGIGLMVAQQVLFTLETVAIHQLSGQLSIMQIALLRSLGGIALVACLAPAVGWSVIRTRVPGLQILRATSSIGYLWIFAFSFTAIPFADATALSYTTAIYIPLLAPLILGETVGRRRYLAAAVGLGGAMLIVKPGFSHVSWIYAGILLGTSLNALALLLTKYMQRQDHPVTVMLYVNALSVIAFLPAATHPWQSGFDPWLLGILMLGPAGMYCGILAVRHADASTLAPYSYVRLILASAGSLLIFHETPGWASIAGAAIILAACLMGSFARPVAIAPSRV